MNFYDILLARALCCKMGSEEVPLEVTENGQYTADEGKAFNPVTVNVSGGGSCDFSTAQATIVNNSESDFYLILPTIFDGILYAALDSADIESDPVTIPLYGGTLCSPMALDSETGRHLNVLINGSDHQPVITGDCTITISD